MRIASLLVLMTCLFGCAEKPAVVDRDRLAFLREQQAPLLLDAVIQRLGPTSPMIGPGGPGAYYGYAIRDSDAFVEFWLVNAPAEEPVKISEVVERSPHTTPKVIWFKDI